MKWGGERGGGRWVERHGVDARVVTQRVADSPSRVPGGKLPLSLALASARLIVVGAVQVPFLFGSAARLKFDMCVYDVVVVGGGVAGASGRVAGSTVARANRALRLGSLGGIIPAAAGATRWRQLRSFSFCP